MRGPPEKRQKKEEDKNNFYIPEGIQKQIIYVINS